MYNRYIPQPDGSFRRSRVENPRPAPPPKREPPPEAPCPPPEPPKQEQPHPRHAPEQHRKDDSITGFLRQLLPRDFDTGDLIVVLLLLLMAGDCEEDRSTALLTLALYMFM